MTRWYLLPMLVFFAVAAGPGARYESAKQRDAHFRLMRIATPVCAVATLIIWMLTR
jgi:hypothetical protein